MQLAKEYAEQSGVNEMNAEEEAPRGLRAKMVPKTADEILAGLLDRSFEEQLELFEKEPSLRYLIKRLIIENNNDEAYLSKWTAAILVWLAEILGIVTTLQENGGDQVRNVLEDGLNIIREN